VVARRRKAQRAVTLAQRLARRVERQPNSVGLLYEWFDAMSAEKGPAAAAAQLAAFSKRTRAWGPALVLGYCLFGVGRAQAAVKAFREAYGRLPAEKTLYALSGALLVTDRIGEAIRLLEAHGKRRRLTARPLVSLANAYLAKGEPAKAEEALRRISPKDRAYWSQLVDSAWERLAWGKR
jgi:tetratricopeptide (TPR) repeat protein